MGMTRRLNAVPLALLVLGLASVGQAQYVEDSIDVGGSWVGSMAYNSREDVVYGLSNSGDFVFAIDCATNQIVGRVPVFYPRTLAYDSLDNKLYCPFGLDPESVLVVDGSTHQRTKAIPMRGAGVAVWDRIYNRVYVSCEAQWDVKVIDCRSDSVIATIRAGDGPLKMHINPRRRKLYAQNYDEGTVAVVDMTQNVLIGTIPTGRYLMSGCYDPCADRYWVGQTNRILVVDCSADTIVACVPMGGGQIAEAMMSDAAGRVVAGVSESNLALTFNAFSCSTMTSLPVGSSPRALHWSADSSSIFVAGYDSSDVTVLSGDGSFVRCRLPVSQYPFSLSYSTQSRRLFVGHLGSRRVYVIRDSVVGVAEEPGKLSTVSGLVLSETPFRSGVTVSAGPSGHPMHEVVVCSSAGVLVRTLHSLLPGASAPQFHWDGRDAQGREAPAGVYLFAPEGNQSAAVRGVKLR